MLTKAEPLSKGQEPDENNPNIADPTQPPKKKRNRICFSCGVCRRRKVKCDRGKPCKRCVTLGLTDQCTYQSSTWIDGDSALVPPLNHGVKPQIRTQPVEQAPYNTEDAEESIKLQVELKSLREKLSVIENTIKTHRDDPVSPQKRMEPYNYKGDSASDSRSPTPLYSMSPLSKSRLPRTSISSLMNPLPASGLRYSYESPGSDEYSAKSYLSHLGIDEREKMEFNPVTMATLSTDGKKFSTFGPLRHFAIMLQDKQLKSIRDDIVEFRKVFDKQPENIALPPTNSGAKMYEHDTYTGSTGDLNKDTKTSRPCMANTSEELVDKIVQVLPNLNDTFTLVERYFKYVYPFLPCLSKGEFMADIKRLLDVEHIKDANMPIEHMCITQKIDYATLGTLLIVLKLGHRTFMSNFGPSKKSTPPPKLSLLVVDLAHLCLRRFALFTEPSLKIFQFALLYRCYHRLQGFEGINENSSMIFNGLLIQMAFGMGLNRDPSRFQTEKWDPERERRWRFLWHMTLHIDSVAFYTSGTNRLIKKEFHDTKSPNFVEVHSPMTREELEVENMSTKMLKIRAEFDELLSTLTDITCRLSPLPSSGELFGTLDKLDTAILTKFGPLGVLFNSKKSDNHVKNLHKVNCIAIYTNALVTIQTVYCHLIFYCERKQNFVACRYLLAKFISMFMRVISNYNKVINDSDVLYGEEFDWLVTSAYSKLVSRSLLGILVCFFRVANAKAQFVGSDPVKFGLLNTLLYNLFDKKVWGLYLPHAKEISCKLFFAWELLKYHTLIQRVTDKAKAKTTEVNNTDYNVFEHMSVKDLQTFIELSNIDLYTTDSDEAALKLRSIIDKLKAGMSFESSQINHGPTYMNEDPMGPVSSPVSEEFLTSQYEDKYWGDLMSKEAYFYDYDEIENIMRNKPINHQTFMV